MAPCDSQMRTQITDYWTERGRLGTDSYAALCPEQTDRLNISGDPIVPDNFSSLVIDFQHCVEYGTTDFCASEEQMKKIMTSGLVFYAQLKYRQLNIHDPDRPLQDMIAVYPVSLKVNERMTQVVQLSPNEL